MMKIVYSFSRFFNFCSNKEYILTNKKSRLQALCIAAEVDFSKIEKHCTCVGNIDFLYDWILSGKLISDIKQEVFG